MRKVIGNSLKFERYDARYDESDVSDLIPGVDVLEELERTGPWLWKVMVRDRGNLKNTCY